MKYAGKTVKPVTKRQAREIVQQKKGFVVCVRSTIDVCFSDLYGRTEAEDQALFEDAKGKWFAEKKGE